MRDCLVNLNKTEEPVKALFHQWTTEAYVVDASPFVGGHTAGQVSGTLAIIELEDGTCICVKPTQIRFIDHIKPKETSNGKSKDYR